MNLPSLSAVRRPFHVAALMSAFAFVSCSDSTSPRKPRQLVFITQPPASEVAGETIQPGISVAIQDARGNTVTDATDPITISFATSPADAKLAGPTTLNAVNGIAAFTDLFINKTGTYTFSAAAPNLDPVVSTALEVKPGPAQTLSFSTQPVSTAAGATLPIISIVIRDRVGNAVTTATNRVTVLLNPNSVGAKIAGDSVSAVATAGIASFVGLTVEKAGGNFQLVALSSGLTTAVSQTFSILAGSAKKLVFTTQPEGTAAGEAINTPLVEVQDAFGNRINGATNTVTIGLGANPTGAVLSGPTSSQPIGGIASFVGLRIDKTGTGYTLVAQSPGLESATSTAFSIRTTLLATMASAGYFHSCGVEIGGAGYCWGNNANGQLGNTSTLTRTTPGGVSGGLAFAKIGAGRDHTCGLTTSNVLYCWGDNGYGQLGSPGTGSNAPRPVAGGLVFADISTGYDHSCGITTSGAAYCWGSGESGELGNGALTHSDVPSPVSGGIVFKMIGAGRLSTCGVATDGAASCWGQNGLGQLGNGSISSASKPVAVAGDLKFSYVSAGGFHSCGLTTNGEAYCWGGNSSGQLGNESFASTTIPVRVSGDHVFVSLSVGNRHNCAITASGDAYCWGDNTSLNLGIGTTEQSSSVPVLVAGGHKFATITAGRFHSCGVTLESEVYCWGSNANGALGNGTTVSSAIPVRVR